MPPVTATSAAVKVVEVSLSLNVMVAVSPLLRVDVLLAMEMVGTTVSIERVGVSCPATFALPKASVNVLAAIEIVPAVVELAVGVKRAV